MKGMKKRVKGLFAILLAVITFVVILPVHREKVYAANLPEFNMKVGDGEINLNGMDAAKVFTDNDKINDIYQWACEQNQDMEISKLYEITGWELWKTNDSGFLYMEDVFRDEFLAAEYSGDDKLSVDAVNNAVKIDYLNVSHYPYLVGVVSPVDYTLKFKNCKGEDLSVNLNAENENVSEVDINVENYYEFDLPTQERKWKCIITYDKVDSQNEKYQCSVYDMDDIMDGISNIVEDSTVLEIKNIELVDYYGYVIPDNYANYIENGFNSESYSLDKATYVNFNQSEINSAYLDYLYMDDLSNADENICHYDINGWSLWRLGSGGITLVKTIEEDEVFTESDWSSALTDESFGNVCGDSYILPVLDLNKSPIQYTTRFVFENKGELITSNTFAFNQAPYFNTGDWNDLISSTTDYKYVFDLVYTYPGNDEYTVVAEGINNSKDFWNEYDNLVKDETEEGTFNVQSAYLVAQKTKAPKVTSDSPSAEVPPYGTKNVKLESETSNATIYYYTTTDLEVTASEIEEDDWIEYDPSKGIDLVATGNHGENTAAKIFAYAVADNLDYSNISTFIYNVTEKILINEVDLLNVQAPKGGDTAFDTSADVKFINEFSDIASDVVDDENSSVTLTWKDSQGNVVTDPEYNTIYSLNAEIKIDNNKYKYSDNVGFATESEANSYETVTRSSDTVVLVKAYFTTAKEKIVSCNCDDEREYDNGTALSVIQADMPTEVEYVTETNETGNVNVTWDFNTFESGTYDPSILSKQVFVVKGTFELPDTYDSSQNSEQVFLTVTVNKAATAAKPVISPIGATPDTNGIYKSDFNVKIETNLENAKIYYTVDGSVPTTSSTLYTAPFSLEGVNGEEVTKTVKAIAVKEGMFDSEVASETYKIKLPEKVNKIELNDITTPYGLISLDNVAKASLKVGSTDVTKKAFNISDTTKNVSLVWNDANNNAVAIAAFSKIYTLSTIVEISSEDYIYDELTAADVTVAGATNVTVTKLNDKMVAVTAKMSSAKEKLISVGTVSDVEAANGTPLSEIILPETVNYTTESGNKTGNVTWNKETIVSGNYDPSVLEEQTFTLSGTVEIESDIDINSVSTTVNVNVKVLQAGNVSAPVFSLEAGEYKTNQVVELSTATGNAKIYYTTDGSTPTTASTLYEGPITVSGINGESVTTEIKAIAVKEGMYDSSIAEKEYVIMLPIIVEALSVTVEAPVAGEELSDIVTPADEITTITTKEDRVVTWNAKSRTLESSTAGFNKVYTATVFLDNTEDYIFTENTVITINGIECDTTIDADTLVVCASLEFEPTRKAKLLSVSNAADIVVPNGTELTVDALGLPATVGVTVEDDTLTEAAVTWILDEFVEGSYDPIIKEEQQFVLKGFVSGIDEEQYDLNDIELISNVKVTVEAFVEDVPADNDDSEEEKTTTFEEKTTTFEEETTTADNKNNTTSPKTGDTTMTLVIGLVMIMSVAVVVLATKKKENE